MTARGVVLVWAAVVVTLLVTLNPYVACAGWFGGALLCMRLRRYLPISLGLVAGGSLVALNPLLATYGGDVLASVGALQITREACVAGVVLGVRLAAISMASALLLTVAPSAFRDLVAAGSKRLALVAALGERAQATLRRDAQLVREYLYVRGEGTNARSRTLHQRLQQFDAWWSALSGVLLDRTLDMALALRLRGHDQHASTRTDAGAATGAAQSLVAMSLGLFAGGATFAWARGGSLTSIDWQPSGGVLGAAVLLFACFAFVAAGSCDADGVADVDVAERVDRARATARGAAVSDSMHASDGDAADASRPAIALRDLRVTREQHVILDVAALEIARGATCVVVGACGSGKTSLLDAIAGTIASNAGAHCTGSVAIDGVEVHDERESVPTGVAMVLQAPARQTLTNYVLDEVALAARFVGCGAGDADCVAVAMLDAMGIGALAHRRIDELSGGEIQLVMLASALVRRPTVLLLDEPVAQLDDSARERFWRALVRIRHDLPAGRQLTTVIVDHRSADVLRLADRVVALAHGRVVGDWPVTSPAARAAVGRRLQPKPMASFQPQLFSAVQGVRLEGISVRAPTGRLVVASYCAYFPAGSVIGITGANGTGKSTVLRALCGLANVRGRVSVGGTLVNAASVAQLVGYVPQVDIPITGETTVLDEAARVSRSMGRADASAHDELRLAGLGDVESTFAGDLSQGERERLAVVAAVAHQPPLLLFDEPTRALDPLACDWLVGVVRRASLRGAVVIVASHDLTFLRAVGAVHWSLDQRSSAERQADRAGASSRPSSSALSVPRSRRLDVSGATCE